MKSVIHNLSQMWSSDWSLTVFLVLLIVTIFIIAPLGIQTDFGRLLLIVFFSLVLISGVAAVSERRALTGLVTGLVVVTLGLRWLVHLAPSPTVKSASAFSALMCFGLLAGVVIFQVLRKGRITWHRIQGAIAVYLLLGLMWAFAYELVLLQVPGSFQSAALVEGQHALQMDILYFSFGTLTTVGYGDITTLHPAVRSLAMLEALVGQLYPVLLIGRLVSMELQYRESK